VAAAATYSFFPAKNLGAFGDAGAITTSDDKLASQARRLANHGRTEKYIHVEEGYNHRMDTIQAAVLQIRLPALENSVRDRSQLAEEYISRLSGLPLIFQRIDRGTRSAWHLFTIRTHRRDALAGYLAGQKIQTGIHYPLPLHLQPAYEARGWKPGDFPHSEHAAGQTLSLPFYPGMPGDHLDQVCESVRDFFIQAG
jgi:dTDP-4-amino-4,6-dideoxygalactose transaminase